jgi:hypothetical protein
MKENQFILVLYGSKINNSRSSRVECYAFFKNGDQLFEFLVQCPSKIASLPRQLEDRYFSSGQVAKISDCYFSILKYLMDNIGVSGFLVHRSNGFLNLIPATTGILFALLLVYMKPDYTLLSKIFSITNPHTYSLILAINSYISFELVKRSVDLSASTLNVLTGIWATDFFSKGQAWATTERILNSATSMAKITVLVALENSEEAQMQLRIHKKLLRPLEDYFNPSEVEHMNLIPFEFSHSDMNLLSDRLSEVDEFSQLEAGVPVQMLLFLLACKQLKSDFNEESSVINQIESSKKTENFSLCKKMLKVLVYRSPTLGPLRKANRIFTSFRGIVNFAKNSHKKDIIKQKNLTNEHLNRCFNLNAPATTS